MGRKAKNRMSSRLIPEEHIKAIKTYREYKRLKKALGKPERYPLDPEKIREDLSGDEFFR